MQRSIGNTMLTISALSAYFINFIIKFSISSLIMSSIGKPICCTTF